MIVNPMYGFPPINVGYGAQLGSSAIAGLNSMSSTAMVDLLSRWLLVSHSRQLAISNPAASAAIDRYVGGVVGSGILYSTPKTTALLPPEYSFLMELVSTRFSMASRECTLDRQGLLDFGQMQTLAIENMMLSGDIAFVRKPDEYSWTAIESDRIISPYYMCEETRSAIVDGIFKLINKENGNRIVDGVELDNDGRMVALWILKEAIERPWVACSDQIERIPIEDPDTGLPLCLFVFMPKRPAQYRGVPLLSPVIEQLFLQSAYIQSEGNAAALQASLYGFITSQKPVNDETAPELKSRMDEYIPVIDEDDYDDGGDGEVSEDKPTPDFKVAYNGQEARENLYQPQAKPITSGRFMHLADGEDIRFLQSTHPNSNFGSYMDATTELISSAVGLPAEVLKLSFNSSYSASRAAIIQAGQKYAQVRTHFISRFVRPVFEVFAYETIKDEVGTDAALYISKALGSEAIWRAPRLAALDPKNELEAYKLAIEMGLVDADEVALAVYGHRAVGTPKPEPSETGNV